MLQDVPAFEPAATDEDICLLAAELVHWRPASIRGGDWRGATLRHEDDMLAHGSKSACAALEFATRRLGLMPLEQERLLFRFRAMFKPGDKASTEFWWPAWSDIPGHVHEHMEEMAEPRILALLLLGEILADEREALKDG